MTVGKYMTYLFVSENVGVIMDSVEIYLWCIGICFIPLAVVNIYRNGIQGLGYGLLPMMAGVAELVGRGAVAVAAAKQRSYTGACMASPAAWILAGSLLLVMYYYIMKVDMKKIFGKSSSECREREQESAVIFRLSSEKEGKRYIRSPLLPGVTSRSR